MSLAYVLREVSAALGFHPETVPDDRTYLVNQINKACKELHEGRDLINCNREQLFSLSPQTQQISLPHYVGQIRGVRNYYTRRQITLHDMRPRYQSGGWTEGLLAWRDKYRSPLLRDLSSHAPITLRIPKEEAAAFTVAVTGATPNSSRVTEVVTFAPGEKSKQTTNSWASIDAITNVALHTYDVSVYDVDCDLIAVLPNSEFQSDYKVVQVLDFIAIAPSSPYMVEVLYKIRFQPMKDDFDQFCCPGYDDAIIWKTMSFLYAKKDMEKSVAADAKCNQVLRQIGDDQEQSIEKLVDFRPNESLYVFNRPRRFNKNLFPGAYPGPG
jgi:hypothetical protein